MLANDGRSGELKGMNCKILNHWTEILTLLSRYFDHEWLSRNNIITNLNELNRYVEKLSYVAQYLDRITEYIFIKSVDPIPSKHIDIDVLVFDDLKHVIYVLVSRGFKVKKIDPHSVTLMNTQADIELDMHNTIRIPFFKVVPLQKVEVKTFYGFKIPDLSLLATIYLADIIDKKTLCSSHILNIAYILSLIKGVSFESIVKQYRNKLLPLPRRLSLRECIHMLNTIIKCFRGMKFGVYLASPESIVEDVLYLLKP